MGTVIFGHSECCALLISYFFTISTKKQGGSQAHKYNRVEQPMNSNFPSVGQNIRCLSLHGGQSYEWVGHCL